MTTGETEREMQHSGAGKPPGERGASPDVISLTPTRDACIETQARRAYNHTVSALLNTPEDPELQQTLETVRLFLEQADFNQLRAESEPHLVAGKRVTFAVWRENGKSRWRMQVAV